MKEQKYKINPEIKQVDNPLTFQGRGSYRDLQKEQSRKVKEILIAITRQRELILKAFIAETGCKPSECEQVEQRHLDGSISWYIRKRALK